MKKALGKTGHSDPMILFNSPPWPGNIRLNGQATKDVFEEVPDWEALFPGQAN